MDYVRVPHIHQYRPHHQPSKDDMKVSVQVPSIFIPKHHTIETYPYRHKRFLTYYDFPDKCSR